MNNIKIARWVWVVVAVQVAFLLSWAGYHQWVRSSAPTIRLKTLPVDPRDILRGDYMILNYEISNAKAPVDPMEHSNVFVILKPEGAHYVVDTVVTEKPADSDNRVWVHALASGSVGELFLTYGIERFFVPEGRGTPTFKTLEVETSVSPTNRLYIRRLWLDGKRFP